MRTKLTRILSLFLLLTLLSALLVPASARASSYFDITKVEATAQGGGRLNISITVRATNTMDAIGVTYLEIKEKRADGKFYTVRTYTKKEIPSLMKYHSIGLVTALQFQGTKGKVYQATATCYAENATGSSSVIRHSRTVTA